LAVSGYKNISRIDVEAKKMHGWYVRIQYNGRSHAKFFSDSRYGNTEIALEEAVQYRNKLETKIGRPRTERYVPGTLHPKNNTGVPGIIRTRKREKKRGKEYFYDVFEVTWCPEPNKVSRTTVSVNKYGEKEAFRRACKIREAKLKQIYKSSRAPNSELTPATHPQNDG